MITPRPLAATTAVALALVALAGCAAEPEPTAAPVDDVSDGHGEITTAAEVEEPPLALVSVDDDGRVGMLDLLSGESEDLGPVGAPTGLASDGRYVFVTTADGVDIVDSARWSWNHGDHFHYYIGSPEMPGTVPGSGIATATWGMLSTDGSTAMHFAGSGEAVLLENEALAEGEIVERFRVDVDADAVVAPLGDGAVISEADALEVYDAEGRQTEQSVSCTDAAGAITTVVGLAIGCAEGAVLVTGDEDEAEFSVIRYPDDVDAERAVAFDGRKGRPTVAGLTDASGFWLLDTREETWTHVATEHTLVHVTAVDDEAGHVVALDTDGRVRVYAAATGEEIAATDVLVGAPDAATSLTVDGQRAYLNDPAAAVVHEIDYADGARIARTLDTPTSPAFLSEVGR